MRFGRIIQYTEFGNALFYLYNYRPLYILLVCNYTLWKMWQANFLSPRKSLTFISGLRSPFLYAKCVWSFSLSRQVWPSIKIFPLVVDIHSYSCLKKVENESWVWALPSSYTAWLARPTAPTCRPPSLLIYEIFFQWDLRLSSIDANFLCSSLPWCYFHWFYRS